MITSDQSNWPFWIGLSLRLRRATRDYKAKTETAEFIHDVSYPQILES
jgi:hypothetical protein